MIGNEVEISYPPQRIVSLVPSQTELLYDLGLIKEVIAITKFCVHPAEWFRNKTRIGGTKNLNIEKIIALQPDLIIANKEENTKKQIEILAKQFPVWVSDIKNVNDALEMIRGIGAITDKQEQGNSLLHEIENNIQTIELASKQKRVAYFIWYQPWMSVGKDTFIHDMLRRIGWQNVFEHEQRYPEISLQALQDAKPDLVLLSSEPFPFKEKHVKEILEILPDATVKLVDGEMFSWYGSRMLKAAKYIQDFIQQAS